MLLGGTHGSTDISRSTVYQKCKTEPSGSAVSKKRKRRGGADCRGRPVHGLLSVYVTEWNGHVRVNIG